MERFARFVVKNRMFFAVLFVVLSIAGVFCFSLVKQNYDLTKYLPNDTDTSKGLQIMESEFGLSNNLLVMVSVDEAQTQELMDELGKINGVQLVTLDQHDGEKALFIVTLYGDEYSASAKSALSDIKQTLVGNEYSLSGGVQSNQQLENALNAEMPIIMAIAVAIIVLVLFVTSRSWLEPLVVLIVLFCGVLINMGSNVIFGEISYITYAVSAVLQLALSLDYSIILLHSYNEFKASGIDKQEAIVKALAQNMRPISSSGLTTIAGLVALFFMSFTIGFDIGIVLAKGILVSLLSVVFFAPALIMFFGKALEKTAHRALPLGGRAIARFSLRAKSILPIIMVIIVAGACVLQTRNEYLFSGWDLSNDGQKIEQAFGNVNQAVLIVDNKYASDEQTTSEFIAGTNTLTNDDGKKAFTQIASWATLELSEKDVLDNVGFDLSAIQPYAEIVLGQDQTFGGIKNLWEQSEQDVYNIELPKELFALLLGVEQNDRMLSIVYGLLKSDGVVTVGSVINNFQKMQSNALIGSVIAEKVPQEALDLITYLSENKEQVGSVVNPIITTLVDKAVERYGSETSIYDVEPSTYGVFTYVTKVLFNSESFDVSEFYDMWTLAQRDLTKIVITEQMLINALGVPIPESLISTIMSLLSSDGTITLGDVMNFIKINKDSLIAQNILGEQGISAITTIYESINSVIESLNSTIDQIMEELRSNFVGEKHSRIILLMDLPKDSEKTFDNLDSVKSLATTYFGEENYLAGESMTIKDISEAFDKDLIVINTVTIVSILLIIALLFRSALIPVVLVFVIQGAIWITMAIQAISQAPIFFMSYIICTCIQMGATIDYGILISNNYRRNRSEMARKPAIIEAVKSAMPTVVTSGSIMVSAGFVIGFVSTIMPIYSIGRLLGVGTIISISLMLFFLPALLYVLDRPICKLTWDGLRIVPNPKDKTPKSINKRK